MPGHPFLARRLVRRLLGVEIRLERNLRVDDDGAAAGQTDDEIGPLAAELREECRLLVEVAVRQHAGHLDDAPQLDFAPSAADRRRPQRAHQLLRLLAEAALLLVQARDERRDLDARLGASHVALADLAIDLRQRLADRVDQLVERLLAASELAERVLLDVPELLIGELEELLS